MEQRTQGGTWEFLASTMNPVWSTSISGHPFIIIQRQLNPGLLRYYPLNGCANSHATGNPASSGWSLISKAWSILNDGTLQVTLSCGLRLSQIKLQRSVDDHPDLDLSLLPKSPRTIRRDQVHNNRGTRRHLWREDPFRQTWNPSRTG